MGGLSSAWKSIKGGFKKIGRGVKKAFKKFGKFMGEIGFLGQLAMTFLLPGIGGLMAKGLGSLFGITNVTSFAGFAGQLANHSNIIAKAAGTVMRAGQWVFNKAQYPFKTITHAVTNFGKFATNKISSMFNIAEPFADAGMQGFRKDMEIFHQGVQKKGMEFKIARGDFKEVGDQVLSDISGSKYKVMSPEEGRYVDNINALKERRAGVDLAIEDAASGLKIKKTPVIDIDNLEFTNQIAENVANMDSQLFGVDIKSKPDFSVKRPSESILANVETPTVLETEDLIKPFDMLDRDTYNLPSLRKSAWNEISGGAKQAVMSPVKETFKQAVGLGEDVYQPQRDYRFSDVAFDQSYTAQTQIQESINKLRQPNQNLLDRFNYDPNWRGFEPVY